MQNNSYPPPLQLAIPQTEPQICVPSLQQQWQQLQSQQQQQRQQHRLPAPGFEESTAGSQWLHAVKLAGLTQAPVTVPQADDAQLQQQPWTSTQPEQTVLPVSHIWCALRSMAWQ